MKVFSEESMLDQIIPPVTEPTRDGFITKFVVQGFLFEMIYPKVSLTRRGACLKQGKTLFLVRDTVVWDDPTLMRIMDETQGKAHAGLYSKGVKQAMRK
jgi:hypothetical protein